MRKADHSPAPGTKTEAQVVAMIQEAPVQRTDVERLGFNLQQLIAAESRHTNRAKVEEIYNRLIDCVDKEDLLLCLSAVSLLQHTLQRTIRKSMEMPD